MFTLVFGGRYRTCFTTVFLAFLSFGLFVVPESDAQGSASNEFGNGGQHTIQGRIYISNGRRSDITGIKIRLVNFSSGEIFVYADGTGTFTFRKLLAGSYTVIVEGGDRFEDVQETVVIDDPGSSVFSSTVRLRGGAKIANVQIYLRPKASETSGNTPGVINAQIAAVPKAAAELYEAAQRSIAEKNDFKAITQLRDALAIYKEFSLAWNDLGVLLQKLADPKGALDAFRAAVQYDPGSAAANLNLGCALYNAKAFTDAERFLTVAIVRNGSSYRAHYYMGLTQLKLGRIDIAEQAFRTAIDVGDEHAGMAHYMLGGIYWSVKRYKDAADELERYLKLEPNAKDAVRTRESIAELRNKQN